MTRQEIEKYILKTYGSVAEYPWITAPKYAVYRHEDNRKWFAVVMRVSRRKFGSDSGDIIDVVNLKQPLEMLGTFGRNDGVYPAYHMNKLHWNSVLLPDADDGLLRFLVNASFEATKDKRKKKRKPCDKIAKK